MQHRGTVMGTMNRLSSIVMLALVAGCFEAKELPPAPGGESNFLRSCDGACGSGLSCVCGVCTRTCSGDAACGGLAANAVCVMPASGSCEAPKALVCEVQCSQDRQCGAGLRCDAGVCRERAGSAESMKDAGPPAAETTLPADAPFVML